MKYIKTYESPNISTDKIMLGNLYKLYPTRHPSDAVVIAKCIEIIGVRCSWGIFDGYYISPDNEVGKKYNDNEYLSDWKDSIPTEEEIEKYELYKSMDNYNL